MTNIYLSYFKQQLQQILHWSLPNQCLWCQLPVHQADGQLCHYCTAALPRLSLAKLQHNALQRPEIWRGLHPVSFDRLFSLSLYQLPWSIWIKQWKFHQDEACGQLLRQQFRLAALQYQVETLHTPKPHSLRLPAAVCFVPLSQARQQQRGFNQAEQLARVLAEQWQVPLLDVFRRRNSALHQSELGRRQRQHNLRRQISFSSAQPLPAHLVLVDDVITTGATLNELCRLLHRQQVQQIDIWTLAITAVNRRRQRS